MSEPQSQSDGNGVNIQAIQAPVERWMGRTSGCSKSIYEIRTRNMTIWSILMLAWAAVLFHWPSTYEGTTQKRSALA